MSRLINASSSSAKRSLETGSVLPSNAVSSALSAISPMGSSLLAESVGRFSLTFAPAFLCSALTANLDGVHLLVVQNAGNELLDLVVSDEHDHFSQLPREFILLGQRHL